jgi:hypothetical protein
MGITAARETLDAALGQKVQTAGGMALNHARSGAKRTGDDGLLYLRQGPAPIPVPTRAINFWQLDQNVGATFEPSSGSARPRGQTFVPIAAEGDPL